MNRIDRIRMTPQADANNIVTSYTTNATKTTANLRLKLRNWVASWPASRFLPHWVFGIKQEIKRSLKSD